MPSEISYLSHKCVIKIVVGVLEKYFAYKCEDKCLILKRGKKTGLINADIIRFRKIHFSRLPPMLLDYEQKHVSYFRPFCLEIVTDS